MGCLGTARHFGRQCGRADEHIAHADLTAAVRLTMVAGKALNHHTGKGGFAVEEDHFVRNEHMVKDDQDFVSAIHLVAYVDVVVGFGLAGVARLTAQNERDAFGIGRARERNGVILIALAHGDGRHNQYIMAV